MFRKVIHAEAAGAAGEAAVGAPIPAPLDRVDHEGYEALHSLLSLSLTNFWGSRPTVGTQESEPKAVC